MRKLSNAYIITWYLFIILNLLSGIINGYSFNIVVGIISTPAFIWVTNDEYNREREDEQ